MKANIFEYDDYKEYISDKIRSGGQLVRGQRLSIAKHIGCQPSYLSQVLGGKPHLTLEQGLLLTKFFFLSISETEYFILLLEYARAGSHELKKYFHAQIKKMQEDRFNLKKRLTETDSIALADQHRYYSAWFYSAIHVILSIPAYQDSQKISQRLNLPEELVADVVHFLEGIGLIEQKSGAIKLTKKRFHLERDSTFIHQHHINWRSQCLQSVEKNLKTDLHYSNVVGISRKDFVKIKELLTSAVEDVRSVIKPSAEEEVYALALDFFKI